MRYKVTVWECACEKCGHIWLPKDQEQVPKICPVCKSRSWHSGESLEPTKSEKKQTISELKDLISNVSVQKPEPLRQNDPVLDEWDGWSEERKAPDVEKGDIVTYREHLKSRKRHIIRRETDW